LDSALSSGDVEKAAQALAASFMAASLIGGEDNFRIWNGVLGSTLVEVEGVVLVMNENKLG